MKLIINLCRNVKEIKNDYDKEKTTKHLNIGTFRMWLNLNEIKIS